MGGVDDLYLMCREYLDACIEAVKLTDAGGIDRAFVSPGAPAFDCCPFISVYAGGPAEADTLPLVPALAPAVRDTVQGSLHLVTMTATVIRCAPVVESEGQIPILPTTGEMESAAKETMQDLWAIWNHVRHLHRQGLIFTTDIGGNKRKREVYYDPAVPVHTAGGCAGFEIQLRVALDGFATPN